MLIRFLLYNIISRGLQHAGNQREYDNIIIRKTPYQKMPLHSCQKKFVAKNRFRVIISSLRKSYQSIEE